MRNFWESTQDVSLRPAETRVLTFGLNFYEGDNMSSVANSTIEFFVEGAIVKTVSKLGEPEQKETGTKGKAGS